MGAGNERAPDQQDIPSKRGARTEAPRLASASCRWGEDEGMNEIRPTSSLAHPERRAALADWLRGAADAHEVEVEEASRLSGGAIQQNWPLRVRVAGGPHAGAHEWVLRMGGGGDH
jgi:hypothetical protein